MNGAMDWIKAVAAVSLVAGAAWVGLAGGAPTPEPTTVAANTGPQPDINLPRAEI